MKTDDGGNNWFYQSSNTQNELRKVCFTDTTTGYAVGLKGTLLKTTNGGNSWSKIDVGITTDLYSVSVESDSAIWVVGDSGLVLKNKEFYLIITNSFNSKQQKAFEFKLEQNYPNPFNPTTVINYEIPFNEYVTIKIYNVLGKEVATLVNMYKIKGNYNIIFDASKLSSGVYFYQLRSGNSMFIKKMLLLK